MIVLRQPAAVVLGDHRALGDRHQRIVRVEILARQEEGLVGGDQRQVVPVGEIDGGSLQRTVVAGQPLDLDVEPVAEQVACSASSRSSANCGWSLFSARPIGPRGRRSGR